MVIKRYIEDYIEKDLKEKMVFISGPRQVDKTTFAKNIGTTFYNNKYVYLNCDYREDRKKILKYILEIEKELYI